VGVHLFWRNLVDLARMLTHIRGYPPSQAGNYRKPEDAIHGEDGIMIYDAILLVSFGGPERPEDVIPFLENVLRGKNVPRERMLAVAEHYYHFGGKSPINEQNRLLLAALRSELDRKGPQLPVYWGNRNWHPLLSDTLVKMKADGVRRALAFVTSGYSSYSSCRQYLENIARAGTCAGEGAPIIDKIRAFYNHPGFISAVVERVQEALGRIDPERRTSAHLVYTAHSIPISMAQNCRYSEQLVEASRLVSEQLGRKSDPLVFQSRSGPPTQPWLGPDILEHLRGVAALKQVRDVVIVPIGFVSDHMEVVYDLDTEARALCEKLGLNLIRASCVGTDPRFVAMIRELILERIDQAPPRPSLGSMGASHDVCPEGCCLPQSIARPISD
jgi:protoporphyrin/coproporphyrin ferrochelatase